MAAFLQANAIPIILGLICLALGVKVTKDVIAQNQAANNPVDPTVNPTVNPTPTRAGLAGISALSPFQQNVSVLADNLQTVGKDLLTKLENAPKHIRKTILLGFLVEIRSELVKGITDPADVKAMQESINTLSQLLVSLPDTEIPLVSVQNAAQNQQGQSILTPTEPTPADKAA